MWRGQPRATTSSPGNGSPSLSRRVILSAFCVGMFVGCGARSNGPLVIATNWSRAECDVIEERLSSQPEAVAVRWIFLPADSDPAQAAARGRGVDLILGGRPESHAFLASHGQSTPLEPSDARPWRVIHRSTANSQGALGTRLAALVDSSEEWAAEYARLVLGAGEPANDSTSLIEDGISLVAGSPREIKAQRFVASLGETRPAGPCASMLPVLLEATLVDCRDDLRAVLSAFRMTEKSSRFQNWMTEAPPWPPASITRLRTQENGMALIGTLVDQIAPDAASRAWLLGAFDRVPQPIDGSLLREFDEALNGRLVRDARFRAWLRSEWTAWASQRYRRVARGLLSSERSAS